MFNPFHHVTKNGLAERDSGTRRHAVICSNVTGNVKERVAQSKRVCLYIFIKLHITVQPDPVKQTFHDVCE